MRRITLLMGPTGAGKSELAGRLVSRHGFVHLSSGRLLREHLSEHPQILEGKLVTSKEVEQIIDAAMIQVMEAHAQCDVLLDGFPRTLDQATWLEGAMPAWGAVMRRVVHLDVDLMTSQRRLAGRGRADDAPPAIAEKWHEYERATRPVIRWYEERRVLSHIDAARPLDTVYNLVMQELAS